MLPGGPIGTPKVYSGTPRVCKGSPIDPMGAHGAPKGVQKRPQGPPKTCPKTRGPNFVKIDVAEVTICDACASDSCPYKCLSMGTGSAFRLRKLANMLENCLIEPQQSNHKQKGKNKHIQYKEQLLSFHVVFGRASRSLDHVF